MTATPTIPILAGSRLHHIGVVVADLERAVQSYTALGFGTPELLTIPEQGIIAAFYTLAQGSVELLQPTDPDGAIGRFLAKRGEGFHHAAYQVDDLAATLDTLAAAEVELIDRTPRIGAHNLRIAFVHPRAANGILTELVQEP
ncbi:MAG TPA: methylmalonyl-CoA epimerase [Thermomicrobiales bacterium]|nr:methylmalonyl-CoA epimerase [Thermomicrobiales bacterium]HRA48874.1 methylmalonyl-CoA epimerase [Thermomicrobiales bacterium]